MKAKNLRRNYQRPTIRSEKEKPEVSFNCPTTNLRYCGFSFSPKKG